MIDINYIKKHGQILSSRRDNIVLYKNKVYKFCKKNQDYAYTYLNEIKWLECLQDFNLDFIPKLINKEINDHWIILVIEHIKGTHLSTKHGKLQPKIIKKIQKLQELNVAHRDLLPSNIIISSKWFKPSKIYIIDFQFMRSCNKEIKTSNQKDLLSRLNRVGSPYQPSKEIEIKNYDIIFLENMFNKLFGHKSIFKKTKHNEIPK